jgi:hypothetical protein
MHMFIRCLLALLALCALPAHSQESKRVDPDMAAFFTGDWAGAGEFASGKKIEADVNFHPELDGQWLMYTHKDRAPNRYKAMGMWGYESASRQLVMTVNDNFGGARTFNSAGWADGKVVFATASSARQERFTFERQSPTQFKMTYEVSSDGKTWRMGDYLVFVKRE